MMDKWNVLRSKDQSSSEASPHVRWVGISCLWSSEPAGCSNLIVCPRHICFSQESLASHPRDSQEDGGWMRSWSFSLLTSGAPSPPSLLTYSDVSCPPGELTWSSPCIQCISPLDHDHVCPLEAPVLCYIAPLVHCSCFCIPLLPSLWTAPRPLDISSSLPPSPRDSQGSPRHCISSSWSPVCSLSQHGLMSLWSAGPSVCSWLGLPVSR